MKKSWGLPFLLTAAFAASSVSGPARGAAPPGMTGGGGLFATDAGGLFAAERGPDGVAAQVNSHRIPSRDVETLCLRRYRAPIIDQKVQAIVLEQACERKGVTISDAEIDERVEALRRALAPAPLDAVIAEHKSTMAQVRAAFRHKIEMTRLAAPQVPAAKMVRCRALLVQFALPGAPAATAGTTRTEASALALVNGIHSEINAGQEFGNRAARFSEADPRGSADDLGVLYPGIHGMDEEIVTAALALGNGDVSPPVRTGSGYWLLQAVSTGSSHPAAEEATYKAAQAAYVEEQAQFLGPKIVAGLISAAHITFASDGGCDPPPGTLRLEAAAIVDGHIIPMKDVAAECLAENGPHVVDILVQNELVDEECRRRGIAVPEAEINRRINALRLLIAPHTIAEGLAARHMTLAELRGSFRQDGERVRLVASQVPPVGMTHCRAIQITFRPQSSYIVTDGPKRSPSEALALITNVQARLRSGADFGGLAARCSEGDSKSKQGDLGILYPGMHDMDTGVLNAGLSLRRGQVTAQPVKIVAGYCLVQAVSTSADHPKTENAAYAAVLDAYREQQAQVLIPAEVELLLRKSNVKYYIHA